MGKNKQGISAVVAVVLTILITIAGVGVIWGAILPMITEGSSFSDLDVQLNIVKSGGYTFWDEDAGRLYVQVSRGVDEANMTGVKFIVSVGGTTVTYPDQALFLNGAFDVPGVNGKRSYILNVSEEPDSIKAIALVVVGNSEKEFSATGELKGIPMSSASDNTGELSEVRGDIESPIDVAPTEYVWQENGGNYLGPNTWGYVMGYKFTPESDKYITELCRYSMGTKVVNIYDENYQVLNSVSVSSASAEWACENLDSPLLINSGDIYYVAVFVNGSYGYYQSSAGLSKSYNGIEVIESVYKYGETLSSPSSTTFSMYGLADIGVIDA